MIYYHSAFVDEEHKIVPSSPIVNQIFSASLLLYLSPGLPQLSMIDVEEATHLPPIFDGIRLAQARHYDLPGIWRVPKLCA